MAQAAVSRRAGGAHPRPWSSSSRFSATPSAGGTYCEPGGQTPAAGGGRWRDAPAAVPRSSAAPSASAPPARAAAAAAAAAAAEDAAPRSAAAAGTSVAPPRCGGAAPKKPRRIAAHAGAHLMCPGGARGGSCHVSIRSPGGALRSGLAACAVAYGFVRPPQPHARRPGACAPAPPWAAVPARCGPHGAPRCAAHGGPLALSAPPRLQRRALLRLRHGRRGRAQQPCCDRGARRNTRDVRRVTRFAPRSDTPFELAPRSG